MDQDINKQHRNKDYAKKEFIVLQLYSHILS